MHHATIKALVKKWFTVMVTQRSMFYHGFNSLINLVQIKQACSYNLLEFIFLASPVTTMEVNDFIVASIRNL